MTHTDSINASQVQKLVAKLVSPEQQFFKLAIVYGLAISLLTLAIPIAVQTLINTVVNIASMRAVVTLSILLFTTLAISTWMYPIVILTSAPFRKIFRP